MLTSMGDNVHTEAGNAVDFAAFVTKPVKQSLLYNILAQATQHANGAIYRHVEPAIFDNTFASRHPLRILLAEDNVVNQKVAQQILGRLGYSADLAADGLEAVAAVQRQPYDLVLMDVQMPEMDGLEATSVIRRALPADQQPTIIAMTAAAMPEDRQRGMDAGMDGYIAKPVRIGELTEALHRAWNAREASSSGEAPKSVSGSAGEFFTR